MLHIYLKYNFVVHCEPPFKMFTEKKVNTLNLQASTSVELVGSEISSIALLLQYIQRTFRYQRRKQNEAVHTSLIKCGKYKIKNFNLRQSVFHFHGTHIGPSK